jgi:hypothetical protein
MLTFLDRAILAAVQPSWLEVPPLFPSTEFLGLRVRLALWHLWRAL